MEERVVNVWPELAHDEGDGVHAHVDCPAVGGIGKASVGGGVIEVGETGSSASADHLANIEGVLSRIVACDHRATQGITHARQSSSLASSQRVVARVLAGEHGADKLHPVVFAGLVQICVPEVAGVSCFLLVELWRGIGCLLFTGKQGRQHEG